MNVEQFFEFKKNKFPGSGSFTIRHIIFKAIVMTLIEFTNKGLYCPAGDFYIDPWTPVHKAIITHAHSDHAA